MMTISIKEDNLTVSVELGRDMAWDDEVSCEDAVQAALDALIRVFPMESVSMTIRRIDPETLTIGEKRDRK